MNKHTLKVAALAGLGLTLPGFADVYTYRTVVMTGDPAPSTIGGEFTEFGLPTINLAGQVAFTAKTNSVLGSSGMWMTPANSLDSVVMITGTNYPIPGGPEEIRFGDFVFSNHHPMLTDDGNVGFAAPLQGFDEPNEIGLFRLIDGTMTKVAIPGDDAPGLGRGVTFESFTNLPTMNENNLMAFKARLQGPGVTANNDQALYMHWFGGLNMLKREGNPVPGVANATFGETLPFWVQINDNGRIAFHSYLNTANGPIISHWTGWPGLLTLVAKAGDQSPIGNNLFGDFDPLVDAGVLSQSGFSFFNPVVIGGQSYSGLWYHNFDTEINSSIAYVGQGMSEGSYTQVTNESWCAAADGATSYRANFANFDLPETQNSAVLLRKSPQAAQIIALEGDAPYGFWASVEFDDLAVITGGSTIIDDTHRVYFQAKVRGAGVNLSNNSGFWSVDDDGTWNFVIRKGQWIALEDGVLRQVALFSVSTSVGLHSGRRPAVNNNGDIAMKIDFTDGVSAIIVAELPTCLGDIVEDGMVDVDDLLAVINGWGNCPPDPQACPGDIAPQLNGDGAVNVDDLLVVINNWGLCP